MKLGWAYAHAASQVFFWHDDDDKVLKTCFYVMWLMFFNGRRPQSDLHNIKFPSPITENNDKVITWLSLAPPYPSPIQHCLNHLTPGFTQL